MKKNINIAIIGTAGIPACYGGFETLVENLTRLCSNNIRYTVYCSSILYESKKQKHNNAELKYISLNANGIQSILYDGYSIFHSVFHKRDIILILGVSGCIFLPLAKFFSKAKIITNIDGLEWKRNKWGKFARKFLKLSEYLAMKYSDIIITDNQAITNYTLSEYNKNSITIAYGGDHTLLQNKSHKKPEENYYLSICRIEPENNIEMILNAFSIKHNLKLKIVGNWNNSQFGLNMKKKFSIFKNIEMIDPIYEIESLYDLRINCKGYIHGHSAGGTNPSLVEAMHFSKPIYAFNCDFNKYTMENNGYFFSNENELIYLLEKTTLEQEIEVGSIMKQIAVKNYTWKNIVHQYEQLFN